MAVRAMESIDNQRLEVEDVTVSYGRRPAICGVTFAVEHGWRVAIVGPNGSGKSTLFKALAGLLPLASGRVSIHGVPLGRRGDRLAYVPQHESVDWKFPVTVADVVMMGRYGRLGWLRRPSGEDKAVVARCIGEMGIANLAGHPIGELSGGQQQRVFLARALAEEPHIMLMDEPFSGVDAATQEATMALLDRLREERVTVLFSTHDLGLAASRFDQVLVLNRRVIAYGPAATVFTPAVLREAFGGQVISVPEGVMVVDQCCPPAADRVRTR
ncbi:MAG: metal ABC transporter ATP-binding protein [Anaerolineae bacterium]